jgi:hypothetical protein
MDSDQRLSAFHCDAGQLIEPLAGNASFLILQAPPTIEPSILKNSLKSFGLNCYKLFENLISMIYKHPTLNPKLHKSYGDKTVGNFSPISALTDTGACIFSQSESVSRKMLVAPNQQILSIYTATSECAQILTDRPNKVELTLHIQTE